MISWKGKTYNEITAILQKNKNQNESVENTFLPNPCKIYRRSFNLPSNDESSGTANSGNERILQSTFDIPAASFRTINTQTQCNNIILQKAYNPTVLQNDTIISDSIRRVRSAGMNNEKPVFVSNSKITSPYFNSNIQYLDATVVKDCIFNPNNPQFSQQGAVSYGAYILRKNNDICRINNALTERAFDAPLLYAENIKYIIGDTPALCNNATPPPAP